MAARLQQPAMGLTDHGNIAGTVQLYQACKRWGIEPLPGSEMYVALDRNQKRPDTFHMGILATNTTGYRNLVRLSTMSHRNFKWKPRIDLADLAGLPRISGLVATTGCWFGLVPRLVREHGYESALQVLKYLAGVFDQVYVEIQVHNVTHEGQCSEDTMGMLLVNLAEEVGLPVITTQDSHYLTLCDRDKHDTLKTIVSWSPDPSEAKFPGDGYHMVDENWISDHHEPLVHQLGLTGLIELYGRAQMAIPELDTFRLRMPKLSISGQPDARLSKECFAILPQLRRPRLERERYRHELAEELSVVKQSGFAPYLLLVKEVTDFMRSQGIWFQTRGSAASSLICHLLGISDVDPLYWNLRFERFLSRDRTKPPDIDLDIEHYRRDEIVTWLKDRYPVSQVSTWLQMSLTNADEAKGSMAVRCYAAYRKQGVDIKSWADLAPDTKYQLRELAEEKPFYGYGVNAAGFFIAPDQEVAEWVPLAYVASSKTFVTQYDKDDLEKLGMVKLDLLGLKTLSVARMICEQIGISLIQIPLNDRVVYQRISRGRTEGVFQLEGRAATRGVMQLRPSRIDHIIAAMALFRPATMESGATDRYLDRLHGKEEIPEHHDDISQETKNTYGVLLYQEQVIGVLRNLEMPPDGLTAVLKAVKTSGGAIDHARKVISEYLPGIRALARKRSWTDEDVDWLCNALIAFGGYGFNLAHATVYGLLAYRTAWMAVRHPALFWSAMLTVFDGPDKAQAYLRAARLDQVKVLPPHVNKSAVEYTPLPHRNAIRKGLASIPGVGLSAAEELVRHAPYESLADLGRRVSNRKITGSKHLVTGGTEFIGMVKKLDDAGALEGLYVPTSEQEEGQSAG
jgi:DNA polymerase-3 subunit alpha